MKTKSTPKPASVSAVTGGILCGTDFKVISSCHVGLAIAQAAERLGMDVVCFASQGRSGLSKLLLGSVAEEVIARVRRPVFAVRPPPC